MLNARTPTVSHEAAWHMISSISTPLKEGSWQVALKHHPDRHYVEYLIQGIQGGFRLGFDHKSRCKAASRNMQSAYEHPSIIDEYITKECALGRVLGPFSPEKIPVLQLSRFGVIPKKHKPNKWRLILDLSHPESFSVNDGIERALCSLKYISVDEIGDMILQVGKGALLAKADIESAYRNVPVHPEDRLLLGMKWQGYHYVDGCLPFGLRSAPKILNALADALEWVIKDKGVQLIAHYLDDYITIGKPASNECADNLQVILQCCQELGFPIAEDKCEGPKTCLTFLGFELDSVALEIRLPQEKLARLKLCVEEWRKKKSCKRKDLESLVGQLQHATHVVRPGRSFLRHMHELLARTAKDHHHIRLTKKFKADLEWWHTFLLPWNGVSMLTHSKHGDIQANLSLWSDASGSWGCAAYWEGSWFHFPWSYLPQLQSLPIATLELLPILAACAIWGHQWSRATVCAHCDNAAVVQVINSGYARDPTIMQMLRCLFFIPAYFNFTLIAEHVPGVDNPIADALSRNQLDRFFTLVPQAPPLPIPISPTLIEHLVFSPDWTDPGWISWFSSILKIH